MEHLEAEILHKPACFLNGTCFFGIFKNVPLKIKKNRSGEGKIPGSGTVLFSSFKNLLKCF